MFCFFIHYILDSFTFPFTHDYKPFSLNRCQITIFDIIYSFLCFCWNLHTAASPMQTWHTAWLPQELDSLHTSTHSNLKWLTIWEISTCRELLHVQGAVATVNGSVDWGCCIGNFNSEMKKSRIRETLNLSTDADHRTDNYIYIFFCWVKIFF